MTTNTKRTAKIRWIQYQVASYGLTRDGQGRWLSWLKLAVNAGRARSYAGLDRPADAFGLCPPARRCDEAN